MMTVSVNSVDPEVGMRKTPTFRALGLACLVLNLVVMGCSQGVNWRDVSVGDNGVFVWLPCKPNTATRQIPLSEDPAVGEITINMIGCEKDGVQFAISYVESGSLPEFKTEKTNLLAGKNKRDADPKSANKNDIDQSRQSGATPLQSEKGKALELEREQVKAQTQTQAQARWQSLWQRASLTSLGIKDVKGLSLSPWAGVKAALEPQAQSVTVKSDAGLEAQYIWFGYRGALYQMAWYKPSALTPDKRLIETYVNSLQIK
jgi:hypothetical protein